MRQCRTGLFLTAGLMALAYVCPVNHVRAEDIAVSASLSANRVVLGTAVEMHLTVHGTQDVELFTLPPLDGIETRFLGPSTQIMVVNGAYSSTKSFVYELLPLKTGKLVIPPLVVKVNGQSYRTDPLNIDVADAADTSSSAGTTQEAGQSDLSDRIKLAVFLPRQKMYVGEEMPVLVKLFVRDLALDDISMPQIDTPGLEFTSFAQPRQGEEFLDGIKFHVVEFQLAVRATRAGDIHAGPVRIQASQLYKTAARQRGGIFDDEFFRGFLGGYQKRPLMLASKPFDLQVLDLPEQGRLADFSGAVGVFDFQVEASPLTVKVGDPVTLRMRLSGSGGYKGVRMPEFKGDGFKVYDPVIRDESGHKILEQVIMPASTAVREIPAVTFTSFDPASARYVTIRQGPFPLQVLPAAAGEEFHISAPIDGGGIVTQGVLGHDIVFIKDRVGKLVSSARHKRRYPWLLFFLSGYILLWGATLSYFLHRRRMGSDPVYARRLRAPIKAREALAAVDKMISAGHSARFYSALYKLLREYFTEMLNLAPGHAGDIAYWDELAKYGFDNKLLEALKLMAQSADMARFAGTSLSCDQMMRDLMVVRQIVAELERRCK